MLCCVTMANNNSLHFTRSKANQKCFVFQDDSMKIVNCFDFDELQVADGEVRVSLLQREVERLSQALVKAQESESLLKEKTLSLNHSLQESTAAHSSTQSGLAALQKTLSVTEQEKNLLQVCKGEKDDKNRYRL